MRSDGRTEPREKGHSEFAIFYAWRREYILPPTIIIIIIIVIIFLFVVFVLLILPSLHPWSGDFVFTTEGNMLPIRVLRAKQLYDTQYLLREMKIEDEQREKVKSESTANPATSSSASSFSSSSLTQSATISSVTNSPDYADEGG